MKLTDDEVSKANGGMGMNTSTTRMCPCCGVTITGSERVFNGHVMECYKQYYPKGDHGTPVPISPEEFRRERTK